MPTNQEHIVEKSSSIFSIDLSTYTNLPNSYNDHIADNKTYLNQQINTLLL